MGLDLHLGATQGCQQHNRQQLTLLLRKAGAGVVVPKAEVGQKVWHRLVKRFGQPGVAVLDLVAVGGRLDGQAGLVAGFLGDSLLAFQRQGRCPAG